MTAIAALLRHLVAAAPTLAVIAGGALLVLGVYGLVGPWWAAIAAGLLLIVWAVLDARGQLVDATLGADTPTETATR